MANPLDGAILKWRRAQLHADTFKLHMKTFLDKEPYVLVDDSQPDQGKYVYKVSIKHALEAETLGLVFGDAVHNFRDALAIELEPDRRVVHVLRDQHVAHAGQDAHLGGDLRGSLVRGFEV